MRSVDPIGTSLLPLSRKRKGQSFLAVSGVDPSLFFFFFFLLFFRFAYHTTVILVLDSQ